MQFNAKQMKEEALPQKGVYHFTVLHTKEKRSAAGNDMFIFKFRLEGHGKPFNFFQTLTLTPKMFWQFEHFCKATGMPQKIDEGDLMAQECDGKEGQLVLDHRANSETGEIEPYVKDYIVNEEQPVYSCAQLAKEPLPFDDDIPPFN